MYESKTRGRALGHWLRRSLHIGTFIIPLIYYPYAQSIAAVFHLTPRSLLWCLIILLVVLEALRLIKGWVAFGQRSYEAKQISSFSWAAVSICLVLLFAPGKMYGIPIIWSCAFTDPLLGELRRLRVSKIIITVIGVIFTAGIWCLCTWWFGTPGWWAIIMGPFIVAAEWPNIRWIDDNAMMQLLPLLLVCLFY